MVQPKPVVTKTKMAFGAIKTGKESSGEMRQSGSNYNQYPLQVKMIKSNSSEDDEIMPPPMRAQGGLKPVSMDLAEDEP